MFPCWSVFILRLFMVYVIASKIYRKLKATKPKETIVSYLIVALLLFLPACQGRPSWGQGDTAQPRAYYHFIKANYALMENKPQTALKEMEASIIADSSTYQHGLDMAQWFLVSRDDQDEAVLKYVKAVLQARPDEPRGHLILGHVYVDLKDYSAAELEYRKVLEDNPRDQDALFALGRLLAGNGQLTEAASMFKRFGLILPDSPLPYYYLGQIARAQNNLLEAARYYRLATQKDPEYLRAAIDLGQSYEDLNQLKNAENVYRQILSINSTLDFVQIKLSRVLLKSGRKKEAARLLSSLEEIAGDQNRLALQIGLIYLEQGNPKDAAVEFRRVLARESHNQQAAFLLAHALLDMNNSAKNRQEAYDLLIAVPSGDEHFMNARLSLIARISEDGDYDRALALAQEAQALTPDEPKFALTQGIILNMAGRTEDARLKLQESLRHFPHDAELYFRLGIILDKLNDRKGMIQAMQQAIKEDPQHAEALNYLAYCWAERGEKLTQALEMSRRALALQPDNPHMLDTLAWIHYMMGDYKKALPLLERAAKSAEEPVILEHLGDAYAKVGQTAQARDAYRRARLKGHDQPELLDEKINKLPKK